MRVFESVRLCGGAGVLRGVVKKSITVPKEGSYGV